MVLTNREISILTRALASYADALEAGLEPEDGQEEEA